MTRVLCCPSGGPAALQALREDCFGADSELRDRVDFSSDSKNSNRTALGNDPDVVTLSSLKAPAIVVTPAPEDPIDIAEDSDSEFEDRSSSKAHERNNGNNYSSIDDDASNSVPSLIGSNSDARSLICALCCKEVLNEPISIVSHLRLHSELQPYKCAHCSFSSSMESEVKSHCSSEHSGRPMKVVYNHHEEKTHLAQLQAKCFPLVNSIQSPKPQQQQLMKPSPVMHGNQNGAGRGLLRKLCCAICLQTIADNPKSIGIHVIIFSIKLFMLTS